MVRTLNSRSSGLGLSPGWGHCLVFLARHITLTVPLSTQVYKWVLWNLMLGWTSIPSREGGVEILLATSCNGNQENAKKQLPVR